MFRISMLAASAAMLLAIVLAPVEAEAGCYRLGMTGYHWYRYCAGPPFLYPHRRVCHNGYCWYR
jgi:hypothetical protein